MADPVCTQKSPHVMELNPGTYWWCSCGKSKTAPFCDGAHTGTRFSPEAVEIKEKQTVALCGCKHSKTGAFCDGTHSKL